MWIVFCGAYYGWTEMVLNIECSGVCEETYVYAYPLHIDTDALPLLLL